MHLDACCLCCHLKSISPIVDVYQTAKSPAAIMRVRTVVIDEYMVEAEIAVGYGILRPFIRN